jgi:hypothetical protein
MLCIWIVHSSCDNSHNYKRSQFDVLHPQLCFSFVDTLTASEVERFLYPVECVFWCMLQLKEWADRFPKGASRHGTSALKKTGVHVMYLDCTCKL